MYKNRFFELAARFLANEIDQAAYEELNEYLQKEEYIRLFNSIKKEWNNDFRHSLLPFNYKRGLKKLKDKIRNKEKQSSLNDTKAVPFIWRFVKVAAIVLLASVITIIIYQKREKSEILEFALNNQEKTITGNTRLILNGSKEIQIESDESEINYSAEDGKVIVDDEREIVQEADESDIAYNTIIVPYGKRSKIILADNSRVWLNSGSTFIYPANFLKKEREVYLKGEALFDIEYQDSHPFKVRTNDLEVKVLGTVFNVTAYSDDNYTGTVLESGCVEINYNTESLLKKASVRITPGTHARYNSREKKITQQQVDTKYYTSWRDGILIYENENLGAIVKKLTRYYNQEIAIQDKNLAQRRFSGKLDLKEDVSDVLKTIAFVASLKIHQSNNKFVIKQ